ncbi:DUF779 domain-containing protein [Nocardia sp. MH4]|uniref:DUF779 domain-containing protein n=1 Tax=Nocardia sp. MH4 TaxID=1768677 RepID=UPI001C4E6255|nr:DUF779 domain-containing protein [Nocardia sp. MH4]
MPYQAGSGRRERHPRVRAASHRHRAIETTEDARHVLQLLTAMHGPVVLYLPADADGYTPICVRRTDFHAGAGDVLAGQTAWHTEFWLAERFHVGLEDLDVGIDVRSAPGGDRRTASLESSCGFRFTLRIESAQDVTGLVEEAS